MRITSAYVQSLSPCIDGIENFNKIYPNYDDTLVNLLGLGNILYTEKVWLACKVLDNKKLLLWGLKCARSVAFIYNEDHPNDNRVNDCFDVVDKYLRGEASDAELNVVAVNAAKASYAARNGAHYAARAATNAASDYVVLHYALDTVVRAHITYKARRIQRELNITLLLEVLNG